MYNFSFIICWSGWRLRYKGKQGNQNAGANRKTNTVYD